MAGMIKAFADKLTRSRQEFWKAEQRTHPAAAKVLVLEMPKLF
jgi:hypothetical protein